MNHRYESLSLKFAMHGYSTFIIMHDCWMTVTTMWHVLSSHHHPILQCFSYFMPVIVPSVYILK